MFLEKVIVPKVSGPLTLLGLGAGATLVWPESGGQYEVTWFMLLQCTILVVYYTIPNVATG